MSTISILEDYERYFIDKMQAGGSSFEEACICVLMYFREFSRPVSEMPAIISRFSPQLSENKVSEAFGNLVNAGLIEEGTYGELTIYKLMDKFEMKLEQYTGISNLSNEISEQKNLIYSIKKTKSRVNLSPKGGVSVEGNYQALLTRLKSARNSIKLAMLCSKVYEDIAKILEEQANKGVYVQILIGSNDITKKIRGKSVSGTFDAWNKRFTGVKNVEIRRFSNETVAELCSSYLIDDSILRLVVYDYASMPSLDGYLLEIIQQNKTNINLVSWYRRKFDEEWEKARFSNIPKFVRAICSLFTLSIITIALIIYCVYKFKIEGVLYEILLILLGACISYVCRKIYIFLVGLIRKLSIAIHNIS